jgi:hypothetical protein
MKNSCRGIVGTILRPTFDSDFPPRPVFDYEAVRDVFHPGARRREKN